MSTRITDLPPELIEQIFDYLQHDERLQASGTCITWREVAFSPKFCRSFYLDINSEHNSVYPPRKGDASILCRNALISCDCYSDDHKSWLIDYLRNAPVESLKIVTVKDTAKWILEHHLAQMEMLHTICLSFPDIIPGGEKLQINHPTLKTAILKNVDSVEINCPKLTTLKVVNNAGDMDFVKCLRGKLQRLIVDSPAHCHYTALSDVVWNKLTELNLTNVPEEKDFQQLLEQMPCLKKLTLRDNYSERAVGKEIAVAKSLSELTLVELQIDEEIGEYLEQLRLLESLTLDKSIFTQRWEEEPFLKSNSIKHYTIVDLLNYLLPQFPNLRTFDIQCNHFRLGDIFKNLCTLYPKLERLSFGVLPMKTGLFDAELEYPDTKSIAHLTKLKFLKTLQLNKIAVDILDWSTCAGSGIENLRLNGCSIDGTTALQLVQVFKHLRQLYFDHCYLHEPRTDVFAPDEIGTQGLRSMVPACKISYFDCHIAGPHDTCAKDGKDVILFANQCEVEEKNTYSDSDFDMP